MGNKQMVLFHISVRTCPKSVPQTVGRKPNFMFFLILDAFGALRAPHGIPGWYPGTFLYEPDSGKMPVCLQRRQTKINGERSMKMSEKQAAEARMTTPSTTYQVGLLLRKNNKRTQARWRGWAKPSGYFAVAAGIYLCGHMRSQRSMQGTILIRKPILKEAGHHMCDVSSHDEDLWMFQEYLLRTGCQWLQVRPTKLSQKYPLCILPK